MKTSNRILTALTLTVAVGFAASPALAGSCGSASHASAKSAASETPAIFDLAGQAGFTTLTAAIEAAGLAGTLNGAGPFTVFAPTDEAFAKLPAGTLEKLLADKDALTKVLLYHVASGSVYAKQVVDLRNATTLNGEKIAINIDGGVMVNDANVIKTDVEASNGVIHVIDTVLIPTNL